MIALSSCGRIGVDYLASEDPTSPGVDGFSDDADVDLERDAGLDAGAGAPPRPDVDAEQPGGPEAGRNDADEQGAGVPGADAGAGERDAGAAPRDAAPNPAPDAGAERDAGIERDAGLDALPLELAPGLRCTGFGGLIACDDFDGSTSGTFVSRAGAATLVDGQLRMTVSGATARAAAHVSFNGVTAGALHFRFSLYVPGGAALTGIQLARLGRFDVSADFGVDVNVVGGELALVTSAGVVRGAAGYVLPRDRWLCALLSVERIDRGLGRARFTIDGTQVLSATNVDTEPSGGVSAAAAGIERTLVGQGAVTLFVDNVLLVSDPPGACE